MIFRIFNKAKPLPPLTEACIKLADFENLLEFADLQTSNNSTRIDNRAIALFVIIMGAAGHFVNGLMNPEDKVWKEVWHYLRDTNLDVITAETIVWITFLMSRLKRAEEKNDHEMFERIGTFTVSMAEKLAQEMIEKTTGFDFSAKWHERLKFYNEQLETRREDAIPNAFASIVLQSAGRRSLAEPLKAIGPLQASFTVWVPLTAKVLIFISTMPSGFFNRTRTCYGVGPNASRTTMMISTTKHHPHPNVRSSGYSTSSH